MKPPRPHRAAALLNRSGLALLPALVSLPTAFLPPAASAAAANPPVCNGTLLELSVSEQGQTRSDRFRFSLRIQAEGATVAAAMDQLNQRLEQTRMTLDSLISGRLTVPAPRTYAIGGGSQGPRRQQASTTISGEVDRGRYDALIQAAGRLAGVSLQGMTSLASDQDGAALADQLLQKALRDGRQQAERTASILGLRTVTLLRIDQRRGGSIRPVPYALNTARQFRPDEAPRPGQSLALDLDYCLS